MTLTLEQRAFRAATCAVLAGKEVSTALKLMRPASELHHIDNLQLNTVWPRGQNHYLPQRVKACASFLERVSSTRCSNCGGCIR
eukprot:732245-Amphidinium_carterae.1